VLAQLGTADWNCLPLFTGIPPCLSWQDGLEWRLPFGGKDMPRNRQELVRIITSWLGAAASGQKV